MTSGEHGEYRQRIDDILMGIGASDNDVSDMYEVLTDIRVHVIDIQDALLCAEDVDNDAGAQFFIDKALELVRILKNDLR